MLLLKTDSDSKICSKYAESVVCCVCGGTAWVIQLLELRITLYSVVVVMRFLSWPEIQFKAISWVPALASSPWFLFPFISHFLWLPRPPSSVCDCQHIIETFNVLCSGNSHPHECAKIYGTTTVNNITAEFRQFTTSCYSFSPRNLHSLVFQSVFLLTISHVL